MPSESGGEPTVGYIKLVTGPQGQLRGVTGLTMMLVIEVVTTALLLFAGATAQKPTTLDRSHVNTAQSREDLGNLPIRHPPPMSDRLQIERQTAKLAEVTRHGDSHSLDRETGIVDHVGDSPFELDTENGVRSGRRKRKVIYRTGRYGQSSRNSGDPYGRRRGNYGPGYDSLADRRRYGYPMDRSRGGSSQRATTTRRPDYVLITATPEPYFRKTEPPRPKPVTTEAIKKKVKVPKGKKQPVRKLTRDVKREIAKYALQHGKQQAATRYENILGRRLPPQKIEKFIKRYQKQQKKERSHQ
ncbi:uncharacterized protein [Macrobrachium rosenbergii]|uniref:uncharacterized protein n=1 Tax=Macrobrachium rosenbergii TaxID=79674 RepID=UPI0034D762D0